MGISMELGLMEELAQTVSFTELDSSSKARASFQWVGTIAALFLLLLNRTGQRSHMQTNLLVLYLFTSFPTVLFKILRGDFGRLVAFLATGANLFFPKTFPVARFILFVITPDWLAYGVRDGIAAGIYCLIIGVLLIITKIRGIGGFRNCECSLDSFGYFLGIAFLFFCTILYLCGGT
ncbi:Cold-regulated protein [Melia azedarach]|uniref:Cold-regulated protein n=1 Tax=Melia azedarach TaxID=155640 RepID=A0ACC1XUC5_MELAZ|nr:Cold-regulated protein [Melia azedarach]